MPIIGATSAIGPDLKALNRAKLASAKKKPERIISELSNKVFKLLF